MAFYNVIRVPGSTEVFDLVEFSGIIGVLPIFSSAAYTCDDKLGM